MNSNKVLIKDVIEKLPAADTNYIDNVLANELLQLNKKIIVLDDDPTGVQTVHDVSVYTDWTMDSIEKGFKEEKPMFFLLTNSRGFTAFETEKAHKEISLNILEASKKLNKEFLIISRSDSTLRGHYPLETKVLKEAIETNSDIVYDGEILLPFFKEGGRFTIDNIHYVQAEEYLVPAGETEFAKDRTFGYTKSHLGEWIEEKSSREFKAEDVTYIYLESIRNLDLEKITEQLLEVKNFNKIVVNAVDYVDVKIFVIALLRALKMEKNFIYRSAACFTKVIGGVSDKNLLTRDELIKWDDNKGGLIVIGSHVKKTTEQLEELRKCNFIDFIELNCNLVFEPEKLEEEVDSIIERCESIIGSGNTVAVYTSRERLELGEDKKEEELKLSVKISDALTSVVQGLKTRPNYIIAKGGITSSDVGTKGLKVQRATVAGQINPGIPVWITGDESKFPGIAYIIFPGNVGTKTTLKEVVEKLN